MPSGYIAHNDNKPIILLCIFFVVKLIISKNRYIIHPKKYAHGWWLYLFSCGLVPLDFTYTLHGYFNGIEPILAPVAVKPPWKILYATFHNSEKQHNKPSAYLLYMHYIHRIFTVHTLFPKSGLCIQDINVPEHTGNCWRYGPRY